MEPNELLAYLQDGINAFVEGSSGNYISMRGALSPSSVGLKLFEPPLIGVAAANDPLFEEMLDEKAVGKQMLMPPDWLEGAQSVVSYFLPMSERVRQSNLEGDLASTEWFHARIEGQMFIMRLGDQVARLLKAAGYDAVCPACHPSMKATFHDENPSVAYHSNWSERHIAYICGLGTFSLTRGIITEKGAAGRLGSVVTTAALPVTERPYSGIDDYCIKCGACIDRCPVNAISLETGKDNYACHNALLESKKVYPGYVGCGKCQVGVPCEYTRPVQP